MQTTEFLGLCSKGRKDLKAIKETIRDLESQFEKQEEGMVKKFISDYSKEMKKMIETTLAALFCRKTSEIDIVSAPAIMVRFNPEGKGLLLVQDLVYVNGCVGFSGNKTYRYFSFQLLPVLTLIEIGDEFSTVWTLERGWIKGCSK